MLKSRRQSSLLFVRLCAIIVLAAGLTVFTWSQPPRPVQRPTPAHPAGVVGTLTLMVASNDSQTLAATPTDQRVELPDVDVYLRNAISGVAGSKKKTQLDGKFYLTAPAAGTYSVCWDAPGIGAGCGSRFKVGIDDVYLKVVPVRAKPGIIYGKVLTEDDRPCWVSDTFFALDVSTTVVLFDGSQNLVQPAVRANIQGEYVFAGLKADRYRVRASCEKARGETAALVANLAVVAHVTLPNHAPRLAGIAAMMNGQGISRAAAGTTVGIEAAVRDVDKDPIEYLWRTADGATPVALTTAGQRNWTLGTSAGTQTQYLIARDGRGGYAFKRFDIAVGGTDVGFSGRVIDEVSQAPVSKATVTVNGASATTNGSGWFNLTTAPATPPERYVLNVVHANYALLSRIHDKASAGDTYQLVRVQTTTADPAQPIDVSDDKSSGPCGGRPARP